MQVLVVGTTATHSVLSTEKAREQLGYQPAVHPLDALRELLDWYAQQPGFDPRRSPAFTDRFDYDTEDTLVDAYKRAAGGVMASVEQHPAPPIHSMPHPDQPGLVDHRGR